MLRLRTSTSLSALALAIGIVGTGGLSMLTDGWQEPLAYQVRAPHRPHNRAEKPGPSHRNILASVVMQPRPAAKPLRASKLRGGQTVAVQSPAELMPLATSSDNSQPWYQLKGHLDGRVVLHLSIDRDGRVTAATVRTTSGDPVLDTHALRSVQQWRFAVPADQPGGISGDLSMRFASDQSDVASAI